MPEDTAAASFEEAVLSWWRTLEQVRGDRADLRRSGTVGAVALIPAFHRLVARVSGLGGPGYERLAVIAAAVAQIDIDTEGASFARQLAGDQGSKARFSGLRFRKLLAADDSEELLAGFRRAIRQIDGRANVKDIASSLRFWNDRTRLRWARDYYAAVPDES